MSTPNMKPCPAYVANDQWHSTAANKSGNTYFHQCRQMIKTTENDRPCLTQCKFHDGHAGPHTTQGNFEQAPTPKGERLGEVYNEAYMRHGQEMTPKQRKHIIQEEGFKGSMERCHRAGLEAVAQAAVRDNAKWEQIAATEIHKLHEQLSSLTRERDEALARAALLRELAKVVGCEESQLMAWTLRHLIPYQGEGDAFVNLNKERIKSEKERDETRNLLSSCRLIIEGAIQSAHELGDSDDTTYLVGLAKEIDETLAPTSPTPEGKSFGEIYSDAYNRHLDMFGSDPNASITAMDKGFKAVAQAAVKEVERKRDGLWEELKKLDQQLSTLTRERDELRTAFDKMIAKCDGYAKRIDRAEKERDEAREGVGRLVNLLSRINRTTHLRPTSSVKHWPSIEKMMEEITETLRLHEEKGRE